MCNQMHGNQSHGLVYIKSRKQLILFGGLDFKKFNNEIWICSLLPNNQYKWIKLDLKLPHKMHSFGYIITNDDKYIIIFGGVAIISNGTELCDMIYIWDLNNMKFYESNLKCPIRGKFNAVIINEKENDIEETAHLMLGFSGKHWKMSINKILKSFI